MSSIYEEKLPANVYDFAQRNLGETRGIREKFLTEINKWLDENPHINAFRDPTNLLHFIRGAKFDIDKAKKKIETFYRMRAERIEWFSNRDPFRPEINELLDIGVFLPLEQKDKNGCQIFIIRTAAHSPKKHSQNDVLKVSKMILDLMLHLDETISIYGCIAILDMANVTLQHGLAMTPTIIKRSVHSWENYSCKNKKMEFVNAPLHINIALDIFRSFMSAKMKQRLFVTRGLPTIDAILPSDLGGNGTPYKELAAHWKEIVVQHADWFAEQEKYKMLLND